jgi:hypothetical protein
MATIVNERDVRLQATSNRLSTVQIPSNLLVSGNKVDGLSYIIDGTRILNLHCDNNLFTVLSDGSHSPAVLKIAVIAKNITTTPTVTVPYGTIAAQLEVVNGFIDVPFAALTSTKATICASVTHEGGTYYAYIDIAKVVEGGTTFILLTDKSSCYVQADSEGNILSYYGASANLKVYYGAEDVSLACTFSVPSNGGLGWTLDQATGRFDVTTGLSSDESIVTLRAQKGGSLVATSTFHVLRTKAPVSAKIVVLTASTPVVRYGADGSWSPTSVTLKASLSNITSLPVWTLNPPIPYTMTALRDSITLQASSFGNYSSVVVNVEADGVGDTTTISKLPSAADAFPTYTALLTNETHALVTEYDGSVSDYTGATTDVVMYRDGEIDTPAWSFAVTNPTGATATVSGDTITLTSLTVDRAGIKITATRKDVLNLLYEQENALDADITKSGVTAALGTDLSPEGLQRVYVLTETLTTGTHYVGVKAPLAANGTYTFSARVRGNGRNLVKLSAVNVGAFFDLTTGAVSSSTAISAGSRPLGDGWWFIWIVGKAPATAGDYTLAIYLSLADKTTSYAGAANGSIHFTGAKVNQGAVVGEYEPQPTPIKKTFTVSKSKGAVTYSLVVSSNYGVYFRPEDNIPYTLTAKVFANGQEVTGNIPASSFKWVKKSVYTPNDDTAWNTAHASGFKSVTVGSADVSGKTDFKCIIDI